MSLCRANYLIKSEAGLLLSLKRTVVYALPQSDFTGLAGIGRQVTLWTIPKNKTSPVLNLLRSKTFHVKTTVGPLIINSFFICWHWI